MKKIQLDENPRLDRNLKFLGWLNERVKNGYLPPMDVEEMQDLVDKIVAWYEIKYPASMFVRDGDQSTFALDNVTREMSLYSLTLRLSEKEKDLVEVRYRMGGNHNFETQTMGICIEDAFNKCHYLTVDDEDGVLLGNLGIFQGIKKEDEQLSVMQLYRALEVCPEYDISELKRVVDTHRLDLEVRSAILRFVTMALRMSKKDPAEISSLRSYLWMEEITAFIGGKDPFIADPLELTKANADFDGSRAKKMIQKIHNTSVANCSKK